MVAWQEPIKTSVGLLTNGFVARSDEVVASHCQEFFLNPEFLQRNRSYQRLNKQADFLWYLCSLSENSAFKLFWLRPPPRCNLRVQDPDLASTLAALPPAKTRIRIAAMMHPVRFEIRSHELFS